jgi:hypothetical protein
LAFKMHKKLQVSKDKAETVDKLEKRSKASIHAVFCG